MPRRTTVRLAPFLAAALLLSSRGVERDGRGAAKQPTRRGHRALTSARVGRETATPPRNGGQAA
jgi:hypothetical protein